MNERVWDAEDWLTEKVREWECHLGPDPTEKDQLERVINNTSDFRRYRRAKARLRALKTMPRAPASYTIRDGWCYYMVEEVHKKFRLPKVKDENPARSAVGVVSAVLTAEGFTGFGYGSVRSHCRTGKEPFERKVREDEMRRRLAARRYQEDCIYEARRRFPYGTGLHGTYRI